MTISYCYHLNCSNLGTLALQTKTADWLNKNYLHILKLMKLTVDVLSESLQTNVTFAATFVTGMSNCYKGATRFGTLMNHHLNLSCLATVANN